LLALRRDARHAPAAAAAAGTAGRAPTEELQAHERSARDHAAAATFPTRLLDTFNLSDLAQRVHELADSPSPASAASSASSASSPPSRLTLLVDTYAVLFSLFTLDAAASGRGPLSACDADLTYFDTKVRWMHTLFQQHHIELVWYMDSASTDTQQEHMDKQKRRTLSKVRMTAGTATPRIRSHSA
jgi:hypothetical protein